MSEARPADETSFDPILVEVMKNELTAIAEEMGITMKRTARSLVAKEGADFSTALTEAPVCTAMPRASASRSSRPTTGSA